MQVIRLELKPEQATLVKHSLSALAMFARLYPDKHKLTYDNCVERSLVRLKRKK